MMRAALFSIALAFPAGAQTVAPPAPAPVQTAARPDPAEKLICKTEETIGTRLGSHRVCHTQREWREEAEQNQAAVQDIQQRDSGICDIESCPQ